MPAPLDWAEVESSPWFNALTPSQKSATHLEWRDTVLSEQEDLDDDTKVKLLALSESRAKALAGQPQDADPLKSYYAEREKKNSEISQGYEAFTQGEFADDPEFSALDETFKGRRDAAMVRGSLFVNPSLVLDKDKYEAAVRASDAPVSEKVLALTQFKDRNEQASQNLVNTLSYTDEDFRKFASDGYNQGKTNAQVVSEWKAQQKLPDGIFGSILGAGRQAKLGFSGGLSGLERAVGGIGMALGVGGEQYAAESGQEAASYAARREIAGGAPIIGEVAEGATSLIPTLAVGAVGAALSPTPAAPAAVPLTLAAGAAARATISRALTSLAAGAVTGGLQSAGSTVADAFEMYKLRGDTDADAIGQARVDGAVSGITTGAVTGLFGALGTKLGAGGGIETLFRRKGAEVLAVAGEQVVKNAFVTSAKSILGNATEEAIEEGTDQLLQGLYEAATRSPDKDFRSILEETVHAAKIGGILGGGMQTIKEGLTFKSMVDTAKTDPALGDPTLNAAEELLGIQAKQDEQDKELAKQQTVAQNPAVVAATNVANVAGAAAVNAADNNAPLVADQMAQVEADARAAAEAKAAQARADLDAFESSLRQVEDESVLGDVMADERQKAIQREDAAAAQQRAQLAEQLRASGAPAAAAALEQPPLPEGVSPLTTEVKTPAVTTVPPAPIPPVEAGAEPTTESLPVTDETLTSGDVGIPPAPVAKAKPKAQTPWKVLSTKGKVKRLKDTDNPELESILYAIMRAGGIGRYSAEQKKAQKAEGKFYGDTDSLDTGRLNAFWDNELFNVGSESTLDSMAQDLHEQGYFPGKDVRDVTPKMLLDKIEAAIAVYEQANRNNGLTDAEVRDQENEDLGEQQTIAFEEATKEQDVGEEAPPAPAPAEAELFPVEPTKTTRPKVRGETDVAQVPQEDLLGEMAGAIAESEAERAQTKIDLGPKAEKPKPVKADEPTPVQDRPVEEVPAAPAAEPAAQDQGGEVAAATEEVAPAPAKAKKPSTAAEKRRQDFENKKAKFAERKAGLQKSIDEARRELNKAKGKTSIPFFDPEYINPLLKLAVDSSKMGIVTFEEFAATVKLALPEFWDRIKDMLSGVWDAAGRADRTLEETPSRKEVDRIIADLDEFDEMEAEVVPADTTEEVAVDEGKVEPVDTGKTISEETAAKLPPKYSPFSPGDGEPTDSDLRQNVGFGKLRSTPIRDVLAMDKHYLFVKIFDDTDRDIAVVASDKDGKERLDQIRKLVVRTEAYREYQEDLKLTPEQIAAENDKVADQFEETAESLRAQGFEVAVAPNGVIRIKLPKLDSKIKSDYEKLLRSNNIRWQNADAQNKQGAYVSGLSRDIIGLGSDIDDYLAGRPVAYQRAAKQTNVRRVADRLRAELDQADDESDLDAKEIGRFVSQGTRKKLYGGVLYGDLPMEVHNEQVYDVALIGKAHKEEKPMFLLASQPGSGKTYIIGAAIERMRQNHLESQRKDKIPEADRKPLRIVYVTLNEELKDQFKNNLSDYDIGEIEYMSYAALDNVEKNPAEATDVLIFDEAHSIRYSVSGDASNRALKAGEWMQKSKFTLLASATPYEDLEQMRFLWAAGAYKPFARDDLRGDTDGGWFGFAEVLGAEVMLTKDKPNSVKFPEDETVLAEMRLTAREYLRKRGMFSQRKTRIPGERIVSNFTAVKAEEQWVKAFDATVVALAKVKGANKGLKAFVINLQKRILEASKREEAIKIARRDVAAGKRVVIFIETRSGRDRDLPQIVEDYRTWKEGGKKFEDKPDSVPGVDDIDKFFEGMIEEGVDRITFPKAQDYYTEALGDLNVVFYTGEESAGQGKSSLAKWESGEASVMVATMGKGGTGLSLHDTKGLDNGGAERSQIILNLPWLASQIEQVAGRTARYGMKSDALIHWLFTPDIEFDFKLAQKVGNRMASMNSLVQGEITPSAERVVNYRMDQVEDIDKNLEELVPTSNGLTPEQAAAVAELNTPEMSIVYTEEDNTYLKMVEDNNLTPEKKNTLPKWATAKKNVSAAMVMRSMLANAGVSNDAPLVAWDEDGKVIPPSLRGQAEPADIRQSAAPSLSPVYGLVKRTLTTKDKLQVKEALRILRKAIPQIDSLVTVDSRENLLKRDDLTEDEKAAIRGPNFAQGIYSNGRVFVAFNNVIRTDKHASEAAAIAGTIVHELMHKGAATMRLSPDLAPVYASWKSMLDAHVTDGDLNVLVRSGYPGYANWRNNSAIREKAQEEVFVKRIESLFHKGDLLTDAEKTLMQRFLSFIRSLVNRLLGKEMSMEDEVVQRWGRFFVVATANRHISLDGSGGLMTSSMGRSPQAIRHAELEAKFNAGTITPEETAEAEKLVEERAKATGYTVEGWHGTAYKFTVPRGNRGVAMHVALNKETAEDFAREQAENVRDIIEREGDQMPEESTDPIVLKVLGSNNLFDPRLQAHRSALLDKVFIVDGDAVLQNASYITFEEQAGVLAAIKQLGFDGYYESESRDGQITSYAVFDPNKVKSAEPFTGVSLDQRFDIASPDIRQSMAPGESPRDGADEPRPASLFSTYITPEEAAAVEAAAARMDAAKAGGDDPLAKFAREQVLGQAGVGMVYKQQQLGPQQEFAMNYIGFTEDGSGLPVVNPAATKKAKSIALDLLNPNSFFAMRYQEEAGNYDAAAAVLQLELTRYAIAMLAKGDASLLSTVRRNWNNIIMGKYLTMASAGRLLQARSHYTGIVATTLDEMTAAQNTAALKFLKEQKAKDPIRTLEDYNNAVANALPDYSALWNALGKGKGIPDPKGIPDLNWLEKAMGALDAHSMRLFGSVMRNMALSARIIDARSKMKDDDVRRSMPDWMAEAEGEELPTDPAELDAMLARVQAEITRDLEALGAAMGEKPLPPEVKKVLEDNAPKVKRKPVATKPPMDKDAPGVIPPEKQKEINDTIAEVDSLEQEGDTKSTDAAIAKLTQLLADLAKVPSPTVPSDSIIAKIRRIVAKHIRNGENVAYSDFYDSMTEDFEGLANEVGESIREDIQEMLIQATWQTFDQAANKTAQDMLAKMKSIKDITYGKPDQAKQVKKEVRAAIVNRDGLTEIPLKKRLTDALIALNVEDDVAAELAEEAYGQSVRYAAKRLALRTAKITEAMAAGGNRRMLAAMAKASPDMVSDPTWQHNAVRSVFQASGFSFEEAEVAATNAASRFDDIFTNSGIRVERNAKKRMDDAVVRLIDKYAALQSDTPNLKKAAEIRKRNIQDLFRQQVRVPIDFDDVGGATGFETLAMAMGATRQQAMILFHEAETETRYNKQRGTDRLILTKLIEFIKTKTSAELNEPGLRDTMVEEFLKSNGFTPEQIREIKPNILNNLEKYLGEARSAAITRILKQNAAYKKALETKDTSFMTEAEKQLKKTLENIRLGIADTTSSVAEVLAGSLKEPVKFLKTDMVTLAQLDSRITAAQNDGRTHDAAIAIKELYELLARRRQSTGFLERLGIAYNNSALSGIATLGINLYGPVGSMMTRVSIDLLRAVKNKDWNAISLVFNSLADTFSNAYAEGALAIRGDAYTNAMQRVILKVNNLRQGAIAATEVLKDKTAKPWDRVKALGVVVQSYTDITRRILSTADQTWFSTMQGYFYKLQASKALINTKMPLPMVQKAVFDITEKTALKIKNDKAMIDTYASRVEALRGKPEEEFRAGINAIVRDTSYLDDDSVSLADEVREYRTTMDNELRSIIRAAALPYKKRPDLAVDKVLKELKLQKLAVDLRQRDLVVKDIDDLLKERFGEAEAKRIKKFAEKESEYEIGNHKGEAGSQLDIFNQFSLLIQNAGYSVIQKNPILGRMLLGYFGVPVNLLNRSLWYTPYGLLRYAAAKRMEGVGLPNGEFYRQSMETAEQMKQRFSEAILGTSVFAFVLALQALGDDDEEELFNVTLAGPTNKTEYDAWVKNGHRKGAIEMNLDGKVYSVNWARGLFEPWKPAFVAMGAYDDMKLNRKLGDRENEVAVVNYLAAAMSGWSQQASFFGAKTTIGSTFSATPDTNMLGMLAYKASPLIPFSGLLNSISKFYTGPNTYRGREGAIWANIPVVSMFATNRAVNALGDPVGVTGNPIEVANDRAWYAGMPLNVGGKLTGNDAKVYEFILERGTGPGIPQRSAIETKNGFITDAEFLDYVSYRGRIVKSKMLRELPKLRAMDDESLSKAVGEISSDATSDAKKRFRYK